jgi:hypothetical protein
MTGPFKPNILDKEFEKFVESPTRANMPAVETVTTLAGNSPSNPIYVSGTSGGSSNGGQLLEKVPITITSGQLNTWITVVTTMVNRIADVTVFNQVDNTEVVIDWRITGGGTGVEIKTKNANTYTVHVEGYNI